MFRRFSILCASLSICLTSAACFCGKCAPASETAVCEADGEIHEAEASGKYATASRNGLQFTISRETGGRLMSLRFAPDVSDRNAMCELIDGATPEIYADIMDPASNKWTKRFDDPRGHVYWIAPQREWWAHQTLFPDKARRHSPWPPDPYIEFGRAKVTLFGYYDKGGQRIEASLPKSQVWSVAIKKTYLIEDSRIKINCEVVNEAGVERPFGLWSITRPKAGSKVSIRGRIQRVDGNSSGLVEKDGEIFFDPANAKKQFKAFIVPETKDACFRITSKEGVVWYKRFTAVDEKDVAPKHAPAELVWAPAENDVPAIIEVEFHGKYGNVKPGETVSVSEIWDFIKNTK